MNPNRNNYKYISIAIIVVALIIAVISSFAFFSDREAIILVIATIVVTSVALGITRSVWLPENYGKNRVRLFSLFIILTLVAPAPIWLMLIEEFLFEGLLGKAVLWEDKVLYAIVAIAGIWIVNHYLQDKTAMSAHPEKLTSDFPDEPNFETRLINLGGHLKSRIEQIDRESNWSSDYFTPLDAEVEMKRTNGRYLKVLDLMTALKKDKRSRAIMILGDPGSGKSVALRKLCKDLLSEIGRTGKLPIYVNLKEWQSDYEWDENRFPSAIEVHEFVLSQLKGHDVHADRFLDKYYYELLETGRLFLVFDSFDEIPALLDEDESSPLISKLSAVFDNVLSGANQSRGILSSRIFRRPTDLFNAQSILTIRPFSEEKIRKNLEQKNVLSTELLKQIFNERPELVPVIRNPFVNELLNIYLEENSSSLPDNISDLYSHYIQSRINSCKHIPEFNELDLDEVMGFCKELTFYMFESKKHGLEMPYNECLEVFGKDDQAKIELFIKLLTYSKLCRIGGGMINNISFVHRRFNEYFVAQSLLEDDSLVDFNHIPTDSRWRDALVLYCELAPFEKAKEIAEHCWGEIQNLDSKDNRLRLRAIHSLRFLADAFVGRRECLTGFEEAFGEYAVKNIQSSKDILSKKLFTESAKILPEASADELILAAFNSEVMWLIETALLTSKSLKTISNKAVQKIILYHSSIGDLSLIRNSKFIVKSLRLSKKLSAVLTYVKLRYFGLLLFVAAVLGEFLGQGLVKSSFAFFTILFIPLIWKELFNGMSLYSPERMIRKSEIFDLMQIPRNFVLLGFILHYIIGIGGIDLFDTIRSEATFEENPILLLIHIISVIPYEATFVSIKMNNKKVLKEWGRVIIQFLIAALIVIPVIRLSNTKYFIIPLGVLASLICLYVLKEALTEGIRIIKDFYMIKDLKSKSIKPKLARPFVETFFRALRSSQGRLLFIKYLRKEGIDIIGEWPSSQPPNIGNDRASMLLAQMEEKWLGLDR